MTPFTAYLLGALLVIVGLALGAYLLNVPPAWIGVGVIVAVGAGIILATTRSRPTDTR
jgi:drug/metabolite transporter (DMT)-like permease